VLGECPAFAVFFEAFQRLIDNTKLLEIFAYILAKNLDSAIQNMREYGC
jgi:hypothetical protein